MSAEERPYSQKINIDCTSFSIQPAISKMLLYAVHCDASLTYLSIGYSHGMYLPCLVLTGVVAVHLFC